MMFFTMSHRLMWTNFFYHILAIRFYISLSVNLTSHFSNFPDFRQLQIPNAQTKYYEILSAHIKIPHNATHKIAIRYFELKWHFWHCKENSYYFWTRVYIIVWLNLPYMLAFGQPYNWPMTLSKHVIYSIYWVDCVITSGECWSDCEHHRTCGVNGRCVPSEDPECHGACVCETRSPPEKGEQLTPRWRIVMVSGLRLAA